MRIEFTKNEIRAAYHLCLNIAGEIDRHTGDQLMKQDIYEYFHEEAFVTVMENGNVIIDVPEELVVRYYQLSGGYASQVVNIGKMIYGLLKQFKFITKSFEKEAVALVKRFIPKTEVPQKTEE